MTPRMIEQFLTTEQVANILQVHPFTILKFIKEGKLSGIKLGRVYRIKESEVYEFLERRSTGPKAKTKIQHPSIEHLAKDTTTEQIPEPFKLEKENKGEEGPHYYVI